MPINPTYPGVYIEEIPSSVRTIVGVSTSVTAFIGRALKGPENDPTLIHNVGEFESKFGGLWKKSTMSYAVRQYFLNGGFDAIIVRVANSDAAVARFSKAGTSLKFMAATKGEWANKNFKVVIDHDVDKEQDDPEPDAHLFNLMFVETVGGVDVDRETFLNISHKEDHKRYVVKVLEEESDLVLVDGGTTGALSARPPKGDFTVSENGSDGGDLTEKDLAPDNQDEKKGIYALDNADIFNLLCIPPPAPDGNTTKEFYSTVYSDTVRVLPEKKSNAHSGPSEQLEFQR